MKKNFLIICCLTLGIGFGGLEILAQGGSPPSNTVAKNTKTQDLSIPSENRKKAYAKLLEGQRHIWAIKNAKSKGEIERRKRLAKNALQKAVEFNPKLAEGYTALADLHWLLWTRSIEKDFDEVLNFAQIAAKLDSDNWGARYYLALIYSLKSGISRGRTDIEFAKKAAVEWEHVGRLTPRNAEPWAFLSVLYDETKEIDKKIRSLKKWVAAASPIGNEYFPRVMRNGNLAPESALPTLGEALLEKGSNQEALEVLTRAVSSNPRNSDSIDLLTQALETVDDDALRPAIQALRQASFADPDNQNLVQLLANTIARTGKIDEAIKVLQNAVALQSGKNSYSASDLQVSIGDIFSQANRIDESISAYEKALTIRGIKKDRPVADNNRDFAIRVINKMVETLKKAGRLAEANLLLKNSRTLLGENNVSILKEEIELFREMKKPQEALKIARTARSRFPNNISFLRKEALILNDLGRNEEAVALVKNLIDSKPKNAQASILYNDFSNYLFISTLYKHSKSEVKATQVANKALQIANGKEEKQIARLNLAIIQQSFGKKDLAEKTLREVLRETPNYPIALNNLGYLLVTQNKNLDEAIELIKKAVRIEPSNSSYLDSLGWAYFKIGNLDEAEKVLQKAFRYNSNSPTILEHLGDVYKKRGKTNLAKAVWQKALTYTSEIEDSNRIKTKLSR